MKNIIIIAPLNAVGGINSWSKNMKRNFPTDKYKIFYIDNRAVTSQIIGTNKAKRVWSLIVEKSRDLFGIVSEVKNSIKDNNIQLLHTTTVGSAGTFRDFLVAREAKKSGVKIIMQCRYGKVPEIIKSKSLYSKFLVYVMSLYDKVWVLDSKSYNALSQFDSLKNKLEVVPNPIDCPATCDLYPTSFNNVVFVANVIASKGILDLVKAIVESKMLINLTVVGKGLPETIKEIKDIASSKPGDWLKFTGPLENQKAKEIIRASDILALPTYYPSEAFPISILEAMSFGKMVIASDRAAIPDMLQLTPTTSCGFVVQEKSPEMIREALEYCINNPQQANEMCKQAYIKARDFYSNDVVFNMYIEKYNELLSA